MRTLIESILDGNLNTHDEGVFTDQIIPEIVKCSPYVMGDMADKMAIKLEGSKRILYSKDKSSELRINKGVVRVLEEYNIHEVRSEGTIEIAADLTKFDILAPHAKLSVNDLEALTLSKCNITCDELSVSGFNKPLVQCNQCQIKTKSYKIRRTPIKFNNSKIIGLDSVQLSFDVLPTRRTLEGLGLFYTLVSGFFPAASFDAKVPHFDPLKELAGIEKIAKLPNIYLYTGNKAFEDHMARLILKSPRIPIDKQVEKVSTPNREPVDCANGYQLIFNDCKDVVIHARRTALPKGRWRY